jgi:hypothetical protein
MHISKELVTPIDYLILIDTFLNRYSKSKENGVTKVIVFKSRLFYQISLLLRIYTNLMEALQD